MERLRERLSVARKALATLEEVERLDLPATAARDVAIIRFVYSFETAWRALQRYLAVVEGVEAGTPKACMRGALEAGLLDDAQTERAIVMVDDRNLTVHTYNEELANELVGRMTAHVEVMRALLRNIEARINAA